MRETIITPEDGLTAMRHAVVSLKRNARLSSEIARRMCLRDVRAMYRQSLLGYVWILIPPIANTLIWVYLNQQKVIQVDTGGVNYPAFVLSGNLLWATFNTMVTGMLGTVQEAKALIAKVNFPHEALLMSAAAKCALNSLVPFVVLYPVLLLLLGSMSITALLVPFGILGLMILGAAISVLLLPIASLYTDVNRGMQLFLRFWFFLTPIIYTVPKQGIAKWVADWNPVTPLLSTSRSWLLGEGDIMLSGFIGVLAVSTILLFLGIIIFKLAMPHLIERMST